MSGKQHRKKDESSSHGLVMDRWVMVIDEVRGWEAIAGPSMIRRNSARRDSGAESSSRRGDSQEDLVPIPLGRERTTSVQDAASCTAERNDTDAR